METTGRHATMAVEAQLAIGQLATLLQSPGPMLFVSALSILSSTLAFASFPDRTSPRPVAAPSVLPSSPGFRRWTAFLFAFSLLVSAPRQAAGRIDGVAVALREFHQEITG